MPKGENYLTQKQFWSHVEKSFDCWLWKLHRDHDGYGQSRYYGKYWRAHRLAWLFTFGEIPEGLHVLHHCDNPPCVNPGHLFLGTNKDNTVDCWNKGRSSIQNGRAVSLERRARGSQNGMSKLQAIDIPIIRKRYAAGGITQKELGEEFGVSNATIGQIVAGKIWKHIQHTAEGADGTSREW